MESIENLSLLLELDELQDTVLHLLDGLVLSETHAPLVGDVVDTTDGFSVFTGGSTDLEVVLASDGLKFAVVSSELGDLDVDGGTDGGSEVGGAEGEETESVVVGEGDILLLDGAGSTDETAVYLAEIATLLHGDDPKVILLIDPDEESLVVVVEDTTTSGPVPAGVSGLEETVTLLEQKWSSMSCCWTSLVMPVRG